MFPVENKGKGEGGGEGGRVGWGPAKEHASPRGCTTAPRQIESRIRKWRVRNLQLSNFLPKEGY